MAYITQYDIDMQNQQKADQGMGMVLQGVQGLEENRRRALDQKRKQFATDMQYAGLGITPTEEEAKQMNDTGYSKSLLDRLSSPLKAAKDRELVLANAQKSKALYEAEQLKKPIQERDDYIKSIDSAKAQAGIREGLQIDAERRKEERERNQPIQDFELKEGIKLSEKDRETLKAQNTAVKNIQTVGQRLMNNVDKFGITSGTGLTQGDRAVTQDLVDLQLQMKELFNLGVLNGPDLELLNKNLGNLQGPVDMLNPLNTKENAKQQIQNVISSAIQKLGNSADARGVTYKGAPQQAPVAEVPTQIQQRIQTYTPEQKAARLQQLKMKQSQAAMAR